MFLQASVILSTGGVHVWSGGMCGQGEGGMHGWGACMVKGGVHGKGGVCVAGGHMW